MTYTNLMVILVLVKRRLTIDQETELIGSYLQGHAIPDLRKKFNISKLTFTKIKERYGITNKDHRPAVLQRIIRNLAPSDKKRFIKPEFALDYKPEDMNTNTTIDFIPAPANTTPDASVPVVIEKNNLPQALTIVNQEHIKLAKNYLEYLWKEEEEIPTIEGLAGTLNTTARHLKTYAAKNPESELGIIVEAINDKQCAMAISNGLKKKMDASIVRTILQKHGYYSDKNNANVAVNLGVQFNMDFGIGNKKVERV